MIVPRSATCSASIRYFLVAISLLLSIRVSGSPSLDVRLTPSGDQVLYAPRVEYPYEARAKHIEGRGYFVMHVRKNGTVARVEIVRSTGHRILDRAVIRAFSQWRFRPGSIDKVSTPVGFSLKGVPY